MAASVSPTPPHEPRFVAIVGGGPIGIETAVRLLAAGFETQIFEAGPIGHTISWWAPHTRWFSSNDRIAIAGVPLGTIDQAKASREEYLNYLRGVVEQFGVDVQTFHRVTGIFPADPQSPVADGAVHQTTRGDLDTLQFSKRWEVRVKRTDSLFLNSLGNFGGVDLPGNNGVTSEAAPAKSRDERETAIMADAVVLAIGGTDFPNRLGVAGESLPHVDGYLREIHGYFRRKVLVVGGRNSAVEAAIRLQRAGADVTLSYHGSQLPDDGIKYWLRPEIEGLIRSGAIRVFFNSRVSEIDLKTVELTVHESGQPARIKRIEADHVLALIGYRQNPELFSQLGIVSDRPSGGPVFDPDTMQTPRDGIYVAGTAIGGTQSSKYQVFLENCHDHPDRIVNHLCQRFGEFPDPEPVVNGPNSKTALTAPNPNRATSLRRRIKMQPES